MYSKRASAARMLGEEDSEVRKRSNWSTRTGLPQIPPNIHTTTCTASLGQLSTKKKAERSGGTADKDVKDGKYCTSPRVRGTMRISI